MKKTRNLKSKLQASTTSASTASVRRALGSVLSAIALLMAGVGSTSADTVTYTANDVINTSSFSGGLGATNWSDGLPPTPGNDYVVASGRTLRTPANGAPIAAYTFAGSSLTLGAGSAGSGSLLMKGSNVITMGNLIMTNGTIINGDPGVTPKITRIAGNMDIQTNANLKPTDIDRILAVTATLSGNGNLTFSDRGVVTLSGAHTYNGPLTVTATTLDMDGTVSITPSSLIVGKDSTTANNTSYNNCTNIVRLGGSLNVGSGPADALRVGWRTTTQTTNIPLGVLDVSLQPSFTANVGNLTIGYSQAAGAGTAGAAGLVYLATNNTLIATNFLMADTQEGTSPVRSQFVLGRGSNYLDTPIMKVGARKQTATLSLPAGGTLVLTNSATGRTDLTVGGNNVGTSANPTDLMDLSGGPFIGYLGTLTVGQKTGGNTGGVQATLTTATNSANAVDVNDVTLGTMAGETSGATTAASGTLNVNGGSFKVNNNVTLGSLDLPGYGTAAGTLNLNGGTFSVVGNIVQGSGTGTVNVNGGLLDLLPSGDATPGTITVDTLAINGIVTNAGAIQVNTALRGSGSITNQTGGTLVSGTLDPGTATTAGTLTLGSLTLSPSATLRMNLTNNTTIGGGVNDLLNINGDLDLGNATLSIAQLTSSLATGTYRLANYTGELLNTLTVANAGRFTLSLDTSIPKQVNLRVSGSPYALRWTGQLGSAWDIDVTQNWINQLSAQDFYFESDSVLFDDSSANPNVTLDVTVNPGNVVFSNNVNAYTLTGAGSLSGPTGITKQGTGALTLATPNDFTGPVTVSAGLLIAGSNGALGATNSGTTIASGATLDVNDKSMQGELVHVQGVGYDGNGAIINSDLLDSLGARTALRNVVLDGPTTFGGYGRWDIRGAGTTGSGSLVGTNLTLTKVGTNGVYLTDGTAATLGDVLVKEGSFVIETSSIINPTASINLSNGAALSFYRLYNPMGRNVTLADLAMIRATSNTTNTQNEVAGAVTLNGQGILSVSGGAQLNMSGPVAGSGGLVKTDSGTAVLLNGANNWLGGTTISNGTLSVGNGIVNGSLPATPGPIINYGTLLFNVASNTTVTPAQEITGTGGFRKIGDGTLAMTVSNSFAGGVQTGDGTSLSGGLIRLLNRYAFGDPSISKTVQLIRAEVRLEGGMDVATNVYFQTSANSAVTGFGAGYVAFRNVAGTNTIANPIEVYSGAGNSEYTSDAGLLTFDGPIFLGNTSSRSAIFSGIGNGIVSGQLSDPGTSALTVEKNGPGTWTLTAANAYGGQTLVRAGTLVIRGTIGGSSVTALGGSLAGNGTINAPVTVQAAGTFAPGNSPGTLTINNSLTLQGTTIMAVGRNGVVMVNDQATVNGLCTYGGTLVITNVGSSPLQPGDSFQVFATSSPNETFASIVYPPGYNWTNSLSTDGRVGVESVAAPSNPPGFPPVAVATLPDGNISLTATGALGATYKLWSSTNVAATPITSTWTLLSSGTITVSPFTINDLAATNYPQRFYLFSAQ